MTRTYLPTYFHQNVPRFLEFHFILDTDESLSLDHGARTDRSVQSHPTRYQSLINFGCGPLAGLPSRASPHLASNPTADDHEDNYNWRRPG